MKKRIITIIMAVSIVVVIIFSLTFPWTVTMWTPIHMPGISGSAGFIGKTCIVWNTVVIVGIATLSAVTFSFLLIKRRG